MLDWQGHIKLIDFGLSKRVSSKKSLNTSYVGSIGYLAPELRDGKGYNFQADLYSLGSLLYEMLHRFPPFTKYDTKTQTFQHTNSTELLIRTDLSPQVKEIMFALLSRDPSKRLFNGQKTFELLSHPWFSPIMKKIAEGIDLIPPFGSHLHNNHHQVEWDQQEFDDILKELLGTLL
jgi:serine/threonine protein kinase